MLNETQPDDIDASRPVLRSYVRIVRFLCRVAFAFAAALVLLDLFLIGAAVVLRYVFTTALSGADEVVALSLTAIVMLAAPEIFRQNRHIAVDILLGALSPRGRLWAALWAAITVLAVALLLVLNGWNTVALSRMIGSLSDGYLEWPVWMLQLFLPIGGALLGLVAIEHIWRNVAALVNKPGVPLQQTADATGNAPDNASVTRG